jgi:hypothetical protein
MANESLVRKQVLLTIGKSFLCRIFPNPRGNGVVGKTKRLDTGEWLAKGSRVEFGLNEGASDFIGIRSIEVTPDMVGKKVGLFMAIETKAPNWKPPTINDKQGWRRFVQQYHFIKMVRDLGGVAGFAMSGDDAEEFVFNTGIRQEALMNRLKNIIEGSKNG